MCLRVQRINNNWGRVEINDGTITSDADCTIKNRGGLRHERAATVATSNAEGTVIDCTGDSAIHRSTAAPSWRKDGIRLADLGVPK